MKETNCQLINASSTQLKMKVFLLAPILVATLLSLASSAPTNEDQKTINDKFDTFIQRFQKIIRDKGSIDVPSKVKTFPRIDSFLNGQHVVNETKLFGLENVERYGNVSGEKTGRYAWNVNGQVTLPAPKIEGNVYLFNQSKFIQKVNYVSIADSDTAFNFTATVNFQWNQLFIKDFYYNYTSPDYPLALTNCPIDWMGECTTLVPFLKPVNLGAVTEIKSLLQNLLASTPLQ